MPGEGAFATKQAEKIAAPIILENGVKILEPRPTPGEGRARLIGASIENGMVKGITEVKRVEKLIHYRVIMTGEGEDTKKQLAELASKPLEQIIEEIKDLSWRSDKEGKRQNRWDVELYIDREKGQIVGMKSNLSDPRRPFEYMKQPNEQVNLKAFLHDKTVIGTLELKYP